MWSAALLVSFCGCLVDIWSKKEASLCVFLAAAAGCWTQKYFYSITRWECLEGRRTRVPRLCIYKKNPTQADVLPRLQLSIMTHVFTWEGCAGLRHTAFFSPHAWKKDEEKLVLQSGRLINSCMLEEDDLHVPVLVSCNIDVCLLNWLPG